MGITFRDESKTVVLIPTFNEVENIQILLRKILRMYPLMSILVVDGHSSDGTPEAVKTIMESVSDRRIYLIEEASRTGYGHAMATGFKKALEMGFEYIITMDGDLSHDPEYIQRLFEKRRQYQLIIGSRYKDGVRVEGWKFRKLFFSKLANMYISYILIRPIWDFTSGFRLYHRDFLEAIDLDQLEEIAYLFQVQLVYLAYKYRFHVNEVPIIFRDRYPGYSKVDQGAHLKTLVRVLRYRAPWLQILHHILFQRVDYKRFVDQYEELVNPPRLKNQGKFEPKDRYTVSVGVLAYNEENIIGRCLEALQNQELIDGEIVEIIVVSSASTDATDQIVNEFTEKDSRIKLIQQFARRGKANAINDFLERATGDIVIVQSADTIAEKHTVQKLLEPFKDETIGMVGARPVPVNKDQTFVGYCVQKLWDLHHRIALQKPKCGEMIAFRNIIAQIPNYTAVDEAVIEAIISGLGLRLAYAPEAVVHNKGPEKLREFFTQRRRIATGHRHLKITMHHRVATSKTGPIWKFLLKSQRWTPRALFYTFLLVLVEGFARFMGFIDYYFRNKNPFVWEIATTSKNM